MEKSAFEGHKRVRRAIISGRLKSHCWSEIVWTSGSNSVASQTLQLVWGGEIFKISKTTDCANYSTCRFVEDKLWTIFASSSYFPKAESQMALLACLEETNAIKRNSYEWPWQRPPTSSDKVRCSHTLTDKHTPYLTGRHSAKMKMYIQSMG